MILEHKYKELWERYFSQFKNLEMPSYQEYLKREEFFETYLKTLSGSEVKYILVAEAPPYNGAYFYDFTNESGLRNSKYFSAPCKAFDGKNNTPLTPEKAQKALHELAQKGIILLDLFPFSLVMDSHLRKKIAGRGILKHFWNEDDYSIKTQIKDLCTNFNISLHKEWDLCLIAPPLLSCHLVGAYDALDLNPLTNGRHSNTSFKALQPNNLRGCDHKKVASDTSGSPNATLIKIAFDL